MDIGVWLTFTLTSLVLLSAPGPVTVVAASYALSVGRSKAFAIVPATILGDLVAMSLSLLGLGVVVKRYPVLFDGFKLLGGTILILLGLAVLRRPIPSGPKVDTSINLSVGKIFWTGFALTALHPGGFVFFTSFAPQFIDQARPFVPQALAMTVTFALAGGLTVSSWLMFADVARRLATSESSSRRLKLVGGLVLLTFGFASVGLAVANITQQSTIIGG